MEQSDREVALSFLPRNELQALAREHGVRANLKSVDIIQELCAKLEAAEPEPAVDAAKPEGEASKPEPEEVEAPEPEPEPEVEAVEPQQEVGASEPEEAPEPVEAPKPEEEAPEPESEVKAAEPEREVEPTIAEVEMPLAQDEQEAAPTAPADVEMAAAPELEAMNDVEDEQDAAATAAVEEVADAVPDSSTAAPAAGVDAAEQRPVESSNPAPAPSVGASADSKKTKRTPDVWKASPFKPSKSAKTPTEFKEFNGLGQVSRERVGSASLTSLSAAKRKKEEDRLRAEASAARKETIANRHKEMHARMAASRGDTPEAAVPVAKLPAGALPRVAQLPPPAPPPKVENSNDRFGGQGSYIQPSAAPSALAYADAALSKPAEASAGHSFASGPADRFDGHDSCLTRKASNPSPIAPHPLQTEERTLYHHPRCCIARVPLPLPSARAHGCRCHCHWRARHSHPVSSLVRGGVARVLHAARRRYRNGLRQSTMPIHAPEVYAAKQVDESVKLPGVALIAQPAEKRVIEPANGRFAGSANAQGSIYSADPTPAPGSYAVGAGPMATHATCFAKQTAHFTGPDSYLQGPDAPAPGQYETSVKASTSTMASFDKQTSKRFEGERSE